MASSTTEEINNWLEESVEGSELWYVVEEVFRDLYDQHKRDWLTDEEEDFYISYLTDKARRYIRQFNKANGKPRRNRPEPPGGV